MLCYENWHKTDGLKQNCGNKDLDVLKTANNKTKIKICFTT